MYSPHILIVDDEANIRFVLKNALKHEGYTVYTAASGAEAMQMLTDTPYDLLLLDLHMKPVDGLTVFHYAREHDPYVVVIILTGYGSMESAVEGLRLGAFDYLLKPAAPNAIRQRVKEGLQYRQKTLRQLQLLNQLKSLRQVLTNFDDELSEPPSPKERFISSGPLVIDSHHRQATLDDNLLELTTIEFDLLVCLVKASPTPCSPRQLVNCAMGYDAQDVEARNIIKWHIHRLRRKVEPDPKQPRFIKNVRHKGYLWYS